MVILQTAPLMQPKALTTVPSEAFSPGDCGALNLVIRERLYAAIN